MHNSPAARPAASSTRSWSRPLRPEPWFRSRAGTLTRPASASVAHLHSAIAGLFGQNRNRRAIRQQRVSPGARPVRPRNRRRRRPANSPKQGRVSTGFASRRALLRAHSRACPHANERLRPPSLSPTAGRPRPRPPLRSLCVSEAGLRETCSSPRTRPWTPLRRPARPQRDVLLAKLGHRVPPDSGQASDRRGALTGALAAPAKGTSADWSTASAAPEKKTEASARLAIMLGDRERPTSLHPATLAGIGHRLGTGRKAGAGRSE